MGKIKVYVYNEDKGYHDQYIKSYDEIIGTLENMDETELSKDTKSIIHSALHNIALELIKRGKL